MRRRRYLAVLAVGSLAGCTGNGDDDTPTRDDDEVYAGAFRDSIEHDGHDVRDLSVDDRVGLAYSPAAASEAGVRESVDDVARAFFDRVYGGWEVGGLDAQVRIDGSLVATWRMERAWIEAYLDGDISREELARRVEESVERKEEERATDTGENDE